MNIWKYLPSKKNLGKSSFMMGCYLCIFGVIMVFTDIFHPNTTDQILRLIMDGAMTITSIGFILVGSWLMNKAEEEKKVVV